MLRFFLHRLLLIVPTFIGITLVAFLFIRLLPGDPVILMAGERGVSPERHAELMAQFGFDQPLWKQYVDYVGGAAARQLRLFVLDQEAGAERVHGAVPGDARARASAPSCSPPCSASPPASSRRSGAAAGSTS